MSTLQEILSLGPVSGWPNGSVITSEESLRSSVNVGIIGKNLTKFPNGVLQLTNLKALGLHENKLSSVPDSITKLTGLTLLDLDKNELSSVPAGIGQLVMLQVLGLGANKLSSVPDSITKLTGLTCLGLHTNELSSLPAEIGQLVMLQVLSLRINKLSSVPASIGNLTNLTLLTLSENLIIELPESITCLRSLKQFLIEWQGRMTIQRAPVGITSLPCYSNNEKNKDWAEYMTMTFSEALKKLKLYSNHINKSLIDVGSLVQGWKLCHQIDVSNNRISTLPNQLSTLKDLRELNISSNAFAEFPDVLLKMSWLTALNISGNPFNELPEGITKLAKLENIVIADEKGRIVIQRAPIGISTLPCFKTNQDLKKLTPAPAPAPVQLPTVDLPAELKQFVLSVAPTINKTEADKLGEGGQAIVYKGTFDGKPVAVKVINPDIESMKDAADEVILTKKIPHQNIVNIIGVDLSSQEMLIVMELADDSLKGMIENRKGPLSPIQIVTFGKQIADALNYCLTQNPNEPIHHRDLKTENVLIVNGQAKLADFGLAQTRKRTGYSTRVSRTKDGGGEQAGTRHWQGPEISNNVCLSNTVTEDYGENVGHRGEMSDVYAFGLILWSMATGKYPFLGKSPVDVGPLLLQGERPDIPADMHPTLAHIIRACWRQNYKLRPRFSNVVGVLSMCGAGNLDGISKEMLNQVVPMKYLPIRDMFYGELYQYLIEQGVPQSVALKLRARQTNGELFVTLAAQKFVDTFKMSETEAQQLVSLQTLAPGLQYSDSKTETVVQKPRPSMPISPPVDRLSNSIASTPSSPHSTNRPIPPKRIAGMNTDELVTYLRGQKDIVDSFLKGIQIEEVSGEGFFSMLDAETLAGEPFNLKGLQLKKTQKAIDELRLL